MGFLNYLNINNWPLLSLPTRAVRQWGHGSRNAEVWAPAAIEADRRGKWWTESTRRDMVQRQRPDY
jgi:hypothetical protein